MNAPDYVRQLTDDECVEQAIAACVSCAQQLGTQEIAKHAWNAALELKKCRSEAHTRRLDQERYERAAA